MVPGPITKKEWENLCDGCGLCCEIKDTSGKLSGVACPVYDTKEKRCGDYSNRKTVFPSCIKLTPKNIYDPFVRAALPDSCAYIRWADDRPYEGYIPKGLLPFNIAHPDFQRRMKAAFEKECHKVKALDGN